MQRIVGRSSGEEEAEWLSVSDLMSGLMMIFLFIAVVFIQPVKEQNLKIKEIARTWQENEAQIYDALTLEFSKDLARWNAEIEKDTLLVRFRSPEVLFEEGQDIIRPEFSAILGDFFPRYVKVLSAFQDSVEEVRIEGHTSSVWNAMVSQEDAYFLNMELSQARTRAVLRNALALENISGERNWLKPLLTANGLSSSRPVANSNGREDEKKSRRVEFRIRTKARTEIVRILEAVK